MITTLKELENEQNDDGVQVTLKDEWTNINEQLAALREEEKGYSAAFGQLPSERRNVTSDSKRLFFSINVMS